MSKLAELFWQKITNNGDTEFWHQSIDNSFMPADKEKFIKIFDSVVHADEDINILEYKILEASTKDGLEGQVNNYIKEGWSFLGPICVALDSNTMLASVLYVREMIRCNKNNLVINNK